jgi:iron complex outermembrane recepter protein
MCTAIAVAGMCLSTDARSEPGDVGPGIRRETQIPAEDLSAALRVIEKEHQVELLFVAEDVRGIHSAGARGVLTLDEALRAILAGTGLTYHIDGKTVAIVPDQNTSRSNESDVRKNSGRTIVVERSAIDEVVVTAQKREQDVLTVPSWVSVISGRSLEESGATRLADSLTTVPGLNIVQGPSPGQDMLVMRGLGVQSPTALVGTYIDDTPVGASSAQLPTTRRALDLLPYDFERIEVLEGPQGTLYGANTMGGLLKYVARKPDLESVTARVGVDMQENGNASGVGWSLRNSINLPLRRGRSALRASFSQDVTPGFIDYPAQGRANANRVRNQAGHIVLLFEPASQAWAVDFSALIQHLHSEDGATVTLTPSTFIPDSGRLSSSLRVPQPFDSNLRYYSATFHSDLRWAKFISATGYSSVQWSGWGPAGYPIDQATGRAQEGTQLSQNKITQELRLVSPSERRLEWLLGAFYTDEQGNQLQTASALTPSNAVVPDPRLNPEVRVFIPSRYREYALFGDATWKLTGRLTLTAGLRESHNEQTFSRIPSCSPIYVNTVGPCDPVGTGSSSQDVLNFTFGPSYHFSPDVMTWLRIASGYRPGGPTAPAPGIPTKVAADTLINTEVGIKSAWLDRKLWLTATAWQIDWKHIQITAVAPPPVDVSYGANGNSAIVRGLEAETVVVPLSGLRAGVNFTYTDAVLSAPMPRNSTLVGNRGDRLPYVPVWSATATVDYTHTLQHGLESVLGFTWRYTGQRYTTINNPGNCPINCAGAEGVPNLKPYAVIDFHTELSNHDWTVRAAVRNITNEYALVDVNGNISPPFDKAPVLATVLSGRLFTLGFELRF